MSTVVPESVVALESLVVPESVVVLESPVVTASVFASAPESVPESVPASATEADRLPRHEDAGAVAVARHARAGSAAAVVVGAAEIAVDVTAVGRLADLHPGGPRRASSDHKTIR